MLFKARAHAHAFQDGALHEKILASLCFDRPSLVEKCTSTVDREEFAHAASLFCQTDEADAGGNAAKCRRTPQACHRIGFKSIVLHQPIEVRERSFGEDSHYGHTT